jgi:F-type H+-transporting ATPase subunit epsilon
MRLSITTPRGALVDTDVEEVTAPGVLGEFGVLPGHVPLMSALKPGVLIYRTKDHVGVVAVGQGFLQVAPVAASSSGPAAPAPAAPTPGATVDRVLVLVYHAVPAGSVDRPAAEKELGEADAELGRWKRELDGEYQALLLRRNWAAARIEASARSSSTAH